MPCLSPLKIYNKYVDRVMYVPCRKCDGCIASRNKSKAFALSQYIKRFKMSALVTLDYDNNHLPVLVDGSKYLYRGCVDIPDIIEELDFVYCKDYDREFAPEGSSNPKITGVIYYRDFQNFIKLLRFNLNCNGKRNFKYFVAGEYGPSTLRPHYHAVFVSDSITFSELQKGVVESWSLCTWSQLRVAKSVKRCDNGVGSYVASYVNCSSYGDSIYSCKRFRASTKRSKDISFLADSESVERVQRVVDRSDYRVDKYSGLSTLEQYRVKRNGVTVDFLSTNVVRSLFPQCKGFCSLPADALCRWCFQIICIGLTEYGRSKLTLSSLDYLVFLGYRRFCAMFDLNIYAYGSIDNYLFVYERFLSFYASIRLRRFMKRYETLGKEYYFDCYQSYADDEDLKQYRYSMIFGRFLRNVPLESSSVRLQMQNYIRENEKILLGKKVKDYAFSK